MRNVSKGQVRKLIGKSIYAVRKDGSVVTGKLLRLHGNKLIVATKNKSKAKRVHTKAFILPLVLFNLLVIATLPYYGGYGGGSGCGCGGVGCGGCGGGYGGYGGYNNAGYEGYGYGGAGYPGEGFY